MNRSFLKRVRKCKSEDELNIISSGGMLSYDTKGVFSLFDMMVYYNLNTLVNIISFRQLTGMKGVRNMTDKSIKNAMVVHIENTPLKFRECKDGLYYIDMKDINLNNNKSNTFINIYSTSNESNLSLNNHNHICLVNSVKTVADNKIVYSKKEIKKAERTRHLQQMIGLPGQDAFKEII